MNVSRSLTFLSTPYSIALSIVAFLATGVFCYIAWRRSGYRTSMGLLELLRLALVVFVAILLNQPEWIEEFRPEEKPAIAVLWDASASMETRDAISAGSTAASQPPTTRHEAIARLTEDATWQKLRERMNVVIQPFSEPRPGHGTDLNDPLIRAPQKIQNLRGVVLASDGDWTEGQPPVLAAAALRMRGVPIFAVPVGSKTRLPDVELLSLDLPTFGIAGKSVRVPFSIESSLPREFTTTVTMRASDGDEVTKEVKIAPMTRTSDFLIWKPKSNGDFTVTLSVPKHGDETLPDNNKMSAPISIRQEKLRVLVVESYPRWEYRYLRNALSRPRRGAFVPALSPRAIEAGRRQQGLHQGVSNGARRAIAVRRGVPGRCRAGGRAVDLRAVPAFERPGRAPGERIGVHAGNARAGAVAA